MLSSRRIHRSASPLRRYGLCLACLLTAALLMEQPAAWAQRARGVDVSSWQGAMDWNKTYAAGARFAFVRASRGQDEVDLRFNHNMNTVASMAAAGKTIYAGAYHFAKPTDPGMLTGSSSAAAIASNARAEAEHFISLAGAYMTPGWLRPVLDLESGGGVLSRSQLSSWANTFMDHVQTRTGVEPLLYMNTNYATNYVNSTLADRDLWIANYNSNGVYGDPLSGASGPPTGNIDDWSFWQYSSTGPGDLYGVPASANRYIDMNVANGDIDFVRSFVIPTTSVPEPSGLLALGGASLLLLARRRRRSLA